MGEIIRRTVGSKRETPCDVLQVSQKGEGELTKAHKTKKTHGKIFMHEGGNLLNLNASAKPLRVWRANRYFLSRNITMKFKNANARRNTLKVAAVERPFELHSVTDAQSRKDVLLHLLGGCGCQSHQGHITKLLLENRQSLRVRK